MTETPRAAQLDSTVPLLRDPYRYVGAEAQRLGTELFRGRLLLRPCTFLVGAEAAALFYDTERFQRAGATPRAIVKALLGEGGVQGMDGEAHRHRKAMLMRVLMHPGRIDDLAACTERAWRRVVGPWAGSTGIRLYEGTQELLTRAVCEWADVPLPEEEVAQRTEQLALLFDAASARSLRHLAGHVARKQANHWIADIIWQVRGGERAPRPGTALHTLAWYRDAKGELVSIENAAVGLLNVLRPTVAIAVFVTLAAHALHRHPRLRPPEGDDEATERFVHEVRRYYPFIPAVVAIARKTIEWKGLCIPKGQRVVLDLHGTNHDRRTWGDPERFRPDRFAEWGGSPYDFIPQGGGDPATGHRCPGESITIRLMKQAVQVLAHRLRYEVPADQDLSIERGRVPALPASHFVIRRARWVASEPEPQLALPRT